MWDNALSHDCGITYNETSTQSTSVIESTLLKESNILADSNAPARGDVLTRHNPYLSRLTRGAERQVYEINCTSLGAHGVEDYVRESLAPNTRTAYLRDLEHFENWGGSIPAPPEKIAEYLAAHADALSVATLNRRLAALAKVHRSRGFSNPTSAEIVKATMRGLKRVIGSAQRQAAPLIKEDLFLVLEATGSRVKHIRDRALLLIGFAGAFRRSELIGLDWEDVVPVRQGLEISLRRSKTDQYGAGRKIGIPYGRGRWCPVTALEQWKAASGATEGRFSSQLTVTTGLLQSGCRVRPFVWSSGRQYNRRVSIQPLIPDTVCARDLLLVQRKREFPPGKFANRPAMRATRC